ncbi:MAG: hypothetical protein GW946_00195 [Candidatus Pacebacteria bacterium]|nr:hypothetical protein [Candidatus Paceibacterota bacterium]PIR60121.1 MAG: hypothetical protein COU67_03390 [Candidatus Pacebacteria bacterium CG10_big_fil_rev_8_21_14_0_10_44_54]
MISLPRWPTIIAIVFFLYTSLFFIQRPHITTLDLGRHLINGRELAKHPELLSTNFFSYTNPDFPFVNHHWLFGWLAYQVFRLTSFPGLVLVNSTLIVSGVILVFLLARKMSSTTIALGASLVALPLITDRADIRPETISFFLLGLWLFLLSKLDRGSSWKTLLILAGTQMIWVNTHLFFVFGWLIAVAFLLRAVIVKSFRWQRTGLTIFMFCLPLVSLVNPSGLSGVLEPFAIFNEYNYPVAENQSLWFFLHYSPSNLQYWYASLLVLLGISTSVLLLYKKKFATLPLVLIAIVLGVLTSQINRVGSFFGLASIPVLAIVFNLFWQAQGKKICSLLNNTSWLMVISTLGFTTVILALATSLFTPSVRNIGLNPPASMLAPINFFHSIKTTGNIFNNYDIGSYLVYTLYPNKHVFIDNRPEAYPSDFIKNDYIAAQTSEEIWEQVVKKYKLGVIFFYHQDATDWAGPFIIQRVQDHTWVPIYADAAVVIFVKDIPEHQEVIEKYRVPQEVFGY